ncbi:hypothetical protein [Clostridium sp. JS66]|uniref:hypothetical protein n=1 Tax=Clostridium sp. JS66 TaxID=3064705 RepID=UPI00298E236F|nr:hypothetical protein [Clostridium sp. JS66]WPC43873.1 hypothetical protein Q6H37_10460 [Clostridium sp. JS66]
MDELLKEEVLELTRLLKDEENWSDLRDILIKKEFKLEEIALVSFMEDEEENEYGVIVTKGKDVIEYTRSTEDGKNNINSFKSHDSTHLKEEMYKYPQIEVAFEMIDKGEIL